MKQYNVKRIFFEEGREPQLPLFEMEDGSIREPHNMIWFNTYKTEWLSKEELTIRDERGKPFWDKFEKDKQKKYFFGW